MITLQVNALTLSLMKTHQDNLNHSTLQMLTQDSLVGLDRHESIECLTYKRLKWHHLIFAFEQQERWIC